MKKRVPSVFAALIVVSLIFVGQQFAQRANPPSNAAKTTEARIVKARPLPLDKVRLTGGPLKNAQDLDARYLLTLEPDRMLALLRQRAGLQAKAEPYGGWDGAGRQLTGHIAGHYLSGVSLMFAATGDARFKERADYIVKEMQEIQEKQGDGYIGGIMDRDNVDGKVRFQELAKGTIRSSFFDLNGLWSPWYVQHKIYAGLRDAYRYTGNRAALDVEIRFAQWAESILANLNEEQIQRMLNTEFGGMNEIAADLYADTGDKRWLALSQKFHHRAVVDPLAEGKDILPHLHGNTQVPKLLGHLVRYVYTGNEADGKAAKFFWNQVALHHSFATGGHGRNEYYGQPDQLNDMVDGRTAETCNVYNMIKLTRALFSVEPDVRYADFHERALFNHILASQDPNDGRVCYMVPVGRGVQHEYQDMLRSFTCCVGSGMESHALHAFGIYYESGDKLWVNLFAPSTAEWQATGVKVEMTTDFPEGQSAALKFTAKSPAKFTLALRRPYWAGEGFSVKVNGQAVKPLPKPDSYVEVTRRWKTGDTVELLLPKTLRQEPLPDNSSRVALMWGPLVLAGDLGPAMERRRREENTSVSQANVFTPPPPAPPLVIAKPAVGEWLKPVADSAGAFRTNDVRLKEDINFTPFYRSPRRRYAIYWDTFTPAEWEKKAAMAAQEDEHRKKIEAATVSFVQPGREENEKQFNQQGEETATVRVEGRAGRRAGRGKWFSYDLPVDSAAPMTLIVTYGNDGGRPNGSFDVLVDGQKVGEQATERRSPEQFVRFFDVQYSLPAELLSGKQKITVRFQASGENNVPGVFGVRIVRTAGL